MQIAKIKVQLNELKNDMEEAIQVQDFVRAQQLKLQMDELEADQRDLQDELTEAAAMAARPPAQTENNELPMSQASVLQPFICRPL